MAAFVAGGELPWAVGAIHPEPFAIFAITAESDTLLFETLKFFDQKFRFFCTVRSCECAAEQFGKAFGTVPICR